MNQENKIQTEYDEIDLMDYVKVVIKRKWLILILGVGAAVAVALLSFFVSPKIYKIDTSLEIGTIGKEMVEAPSQVVEKINNDVYGIFIREKLGISELTYPKIKTENPKDTRLILLTIESANAQQVKDILGEINSLISIEHQEKIKLKKELLEKDIKLLENNIGVSEKDIERVKAKIGFLEEEKKNLAAKVEALQKILPYQQDPGTQFALFDTKEKLEQKKQEIEDRYLDINSSEEKINSLRNQINSLQGQLGDIQPTQVLKSPSVSERPIKPRPVLNILIGGILGLFIGVFLAFGKEWWEKARIKN